MFPCFRGGKLGADSSNRNAGSLTGDERMKQRELGRSGLTVSAIGLGCMGMSQAYGTRDDEESMRTLHRALDLGLTFLDTADAYGDGANERLVGGAIRGRRAEVVLATKFGILRDASGMPRGVDGSPGLRAPGVRPEPVAAGRRADRSATISTASTRRRRSRSRWERWPIWCGRERCDTSACRKRRRRRIRRAHAVHPIAALQSEYSLWNREPETDVLPVCRELGIGFVPFSPLGRGFLSGTVTGTAELPADDYRRIAAAIPGRERAAESGAGRPARSDRGAQGLRRLAAGARLDSGARRRHRADPRDEAANLPREQHRGGGHRADARGAREHRGGVSSRRRGRACAIRPR